MRVILVRHARTGLNSKRIYQGQGVNSKLDRIGLSQAFKVAERLSSIKIDAAYSSDLDRAMVTADAIASFQPSSLEVRFTSELRERNLGVYEGTPIDEGRYMKDFEESGLEYASFCPHKGESWAMLYARAAISFLKITRTDPVEDLLLVSHGGWLTALLLFLLSKGLTRQNQITHVPNNASVSIIHWDNQKALLQKVETLNDTAHLQ